MASERERYEPACMVAHNLISKLAAIVGRCDLLNEGTKQSAESAKHIAVIRDIAESAIKGANRASAIDRSGEAKGGIKSRVRRCS